KRILSTALDATKTQYVRPALSTILAIGLRTPDVEETLIRLSKRSDDVGDTALSCFAGLRPEEEVRNQIVSRILRRLPRRPGDAFSFAIQELADPRFIHVLSRRLSQKSENCWQDITLLGRIAHGAPGDQLLQKRIWRV